MLCQLRAGSIALGELLLEVAHFRTIGSGIALTESLSSLVFFRELFLDLADSADSGTRSALALTAAEAAKAAHATGGSTTGGSTTGRSTTGRCTTGTLGIAFLLKEPGPDVLIRISVVPGVVTDAGIFRISNIAAGVLQHIVGSQLGTEAGQKDLADPGRVPHGRRRR